MGVREDSGKLLVNKPTHNPAKAKSCMQPRAVVLALHPGGGEGYGVFRALSPGAEAEMYS